MVNTEPTGFAYGSQGYYNILNIVVNTELNPSDDIMRIYYNILNIVVNTELMLHYYN